MKADICSKIRTLRKKHRYTQEDVARLLHMSQNAYSELENGKTKLDIERLIDIARLYNIPVQSLWPAGQDKES